MPLPFLDRAFGQDFNLDLAGPAGDALLPLAILVHGGVRISTRAGHPIQPHLQPTEAGLAWYRSLTDPLLRALSPADRRLAHHSLFCDCAAVALGSIPGVHRGLPVHDEHARLGLRRARLSCGHHLLPAVQGGPSSLMRAQWINRLGGIAHSLPCSLMRAQWINPLGGHRPFASLFACPSRQPHWSCLPLLLFGRAFALLTAICRRHLLPAACASTT